MTTTVCAVYVRQIYGRRRRVDVVTCPIMCWPHTSGLLGGDATTVREVANDGDDDYDPVAEEVLEQLRRLVGGLLPSDAVRDLLATVRGHIDLWVYADSVANRICVGELDRVCALWDSDTRGVAVANASPTGAPWRVLI